jgi:hypothetical protein
MCVAAVIGGCTAESDPRPPSPGLPEVVAAQAGAGYADYRLSEDGQHYQPGPAVDGDIVLPTREDILARPVFQPGAEVGMRTIPGGGALMLVDATGTDRGVLAVSSGATLIALDLDSDRRADLTVQVAPNGGASSLRLRRDAASIAAVAAYLDGSSPWCATTESTPTAGTVLLLCPHRTATPRVSALIVGTGMRVAGARRTTTPARHQVGEVGVVQVHQPTGPLDLPALQLDPRSGGLSLDLRRCTDNASLARNLELLLDEGVPAILAIQRFVEDETATRVLGEQEIVVFGAVAAAAGGAFAAALAGAGAFFIRRAGEEVDRIGRNARRAIEDANREINEGRRAVSEGAKARAVTKIDTAYRILSRAQFSASRDPAVYGTGFWQEDCGYTDNRAKTLASHPTIVSALHDAVSVAILPNMHRVVGTDTDCTSPAGGQLRNPDARCIGSGVAAPRIVDGGLLVALRHPLEFHQVRDYVLLAPEDLSGYRVLAWHAGSPSPFWPID